MHLAQRSAKDREILREHIHQPAIDRAPAGDHRIGQVLLPVQAKIVGAVGDKCIQLAERALVQQQINAFAGGEPPVLVLGIHARDAPALLGFVLS